MSGDGMSERIRRAAGLTPAEPQPDPETPPTVDFDAGARTAPPVRESIGRRMDRAIREQLYGGRTR